MQFKAVRRPLSGIDKGVFAAVRVLAMGGSAIAIIGILVFAFRLAATGSDTRVTYREVAAELAAARTTEERLDLPDNLKPYFSGANEQLLRGWLAGLDPSEKKEFIENLSGIVDEAGANKADPAPAIDAYRYLKLKKISEQTTENFTELLSRFEYAAAMLACMMILGVMALIFVLLSIERNTRPPLS